MRVYYTNVFSRLLNAKRKVVLLRGSAGSGKSYAVAQFLTCIARNYQGIRILALRKTAPAIKESIQRGIDDAISSLRIPPNKIKRNKTLKEYYIGESLIQMAGLDDPEKQKSTEWDIIWMEEATEFSFEDFVQLKLRVGRSKTRNEFPKHLILSFNPVSGEHWIKKKVLDNVCDPVTEIHSTYKDNPFLSKEYRKTLHNLQFTNLNLYKVYALGEWGTFEGLIYTNWKTFDKLPFDTCETAYGLDFGFNVPTALVQTFSLPKSDDLYIHELLYKVKLTNSGLIYELPKLHVKKNVKMFADSAEPARIAEIKSAGYKILPADKSVSDGIEFLQRKNLYISKDSINIIKELSSYSWKKDKLNQETDEPVKYLDHALDAIRYSATGMRKAFVPSFKIIAEQSTNIWNMG